MNGQRHMISIEFIKVRLRTDRLFALKFEAAKLEIEEFVQTNMRELRKILQKVVINCVENFKK